MSQKPGKQTTPAPIAGNIDGALAPITAMMSSRLMVLANLLKRGAILRYKRLAGLSSVEFGLVASLGRRPPMSVVRLAEAVLALPFAGTRVRLDEAHHHVGGAAPFLGREVVARARVGQHHGVPAIRKQMCPGNDGRRRGDATTHRP